MDVPVGLVPTSSRIHTVYASINAWTAVILVMHTIGLDKRTESVEEPAMTVQLLLVLLFQTEYDLAIQCY